MCSLHPQCHEVSKADAFIQSNLQVAYSKDNLKLSALLKATMLMGSDFSVVILGKNLQTKVS